VTFLSEKEDMKKRKNPGWTPLKEINNIDAAAAAAAEQAGDASTSLLMGMGTTVEEKLATQHSGVKHKNTLVRDPQTPLPKEHERRDAAASTTISFSSLLTEARAPRVILKERETHVKRNLQGDFIKAMQNESVEKDETEQIQKEKRKRKKRKWMPWHSWFCRGCGKKLPDGHMNCVGKALHNFDMCLKYGPCLGVTRYERWLRAFDLGLNPPEIVLDILNHAQNPDYLNKCLWEGQV